MVRVKSMYIGFVLGLGANFAHRPLQKAPKVLFALSNKLEEPQLRAALDYGRPPRESPRDAGGPA